VAERSVYISMSATIVCNRKAIDASNARANP